MTVLPPSMYERLRATPWRDLLRGRVTGTLAWERRVSICGLSDALKGVVLEVTKRTGLWRVEKAEVAQELIAHFYDGLDAGVSPEELIKRFGDVKTAAKLITRAKKRGRAWPWHVWHRTVQVLAVLFVVYVGVAVWLLMQSPVVSVDYAQAFNSRLAKYPEDQAAWRGYAKAWDWDTGTLEKVSTDCFYVTVKDKKGVETVEMVYPGDAGWAKVRTFLKSHGDLLDQLRSAGQKPMLGLEVDSKLRLETWRVFPKAARAVPEGQEAQEVMQQHLNFLSGMRKSATLLAYDMMDAGDMGDARRAVEDYKALVKMAAQMHGHDMLMGLISLAIYSMANENLALVMTQHPGLFSRAELSVLVSFIVHGREVCRPDYPLEKMRLMNMIQHVYSDDGHGDGNFTLAGYRWWKKDMGASEQAESSTDEWVMLAALPPVVLGQYSRKEATQFLSAYCDALEQQANKPLWEWAPAGKGKKPEESFSAAFEQSQGGTIVWRNAWVWKTLPMPGGMRPTSQIVGANADALLVVVALEAFKRDKGRYPAALSELPMRKLPVDPTTGKALLLRYESGRPVIYGRGADGNDDGGVLEPLPAGERKASILPPKDGGEKDWILFPVRVRAEKRE